MTALARLYLFFPFYFVFVFVYTTRIVFENEKPVNNPFSPCTTREAFLYNRDGDAQRTF